MRVPHANHRLHQHSFAVAIDNNLGGASNSAPQGNLSPSSPPYGYSLLGSGNVVSRVPGQAGAILTY